MESRDVTCEHGTAMDVHCCNCHSGFLFDVNECWCTVEAERRWFDRAPGMWMILVLFSLLVGCLVGWLFWLVTSR